MKIIGKERLHDLGFDIIVEGKLSAQQATMVNKVEEDLPFTSDLAEADNMELQKITEKAARSIDNLIELFHVSFNIGDLQLLSKCHGDSCRIRN